MVDFLNWHSTSEAFEFEDFFCFRLCFFPKWHKRCKKSELGMLFRRNIWTIRLRFLGAFFEA